MNIPHSCSPYCSALATCACSLVHTVHTCCMFWLFSHQQSTRTSTLHVCLDTSQNFLLSLFLFFFHDKRISNLNITHYSSKRTSTDSFTHYASNLSKEALDVSKSTAVTSILYGWSSVLLLRSWVLLWLRAVEKSHLSYFPTSTLCPQQCQISTSTPEMVMSRKSEHKRTYTLRKYSSRKEGERTCYDTKRQEKQAI